MEDLRVVTTARDAYVIEAYAHLSRRLRADRCLSRADALDTVQRCIVRLIEHVDDYMRRYPSPRAVAAALATAGVADFRRTERAQRGEGARLRIDADGRPVTGRRVGPLTDASMVPLDARGRPDPRRLRHDARWESGYEAAEHVDELRQALADLPVRVATLLWLVRVEGRDVTEAAAMLGWSRSHASRQLSKGERLALPVGSAR